MRKTYYIRFQTIVTLSKSYGNYRALKPPKTDEIEEDTFKMIKTF